MKQYKLKKDHQKKVNEVCDLLDAIFEYAKVDPNLFISALYTSIANAFKINGASVEVFCQETEDMKQFYKKIWNDLP